MYTTSHATASGLRSDFAYHELKHRLLLGDYGLSSRLAEERLAAMFGVSRTPVREALMRLQAEGLVRRAPDGGYLPVAPDVAVMRHLYEIRVGLELQALGRPLRSGQPHDARALRALREEWAAMRVEQPEPGAGFVLLDESFHLALAEAAGNPVLVDLLGSINERIRIVRMQDFLTADRIERTIEEHLDIVDALLAGDLVATERRFGRHVEASIAVVEDRVHRALARMATAEAHSL
ncbi:MAG: GntR family transcriptional regulator [Acidimicrobiia bacterium]